MNKKNIFLLVPFLTVIATMGIWHYNPCTSISNAQKITSNVPKSFVIVIPSFNNKEWYERNLSSIAQQTYRNFRIIYIDDCSPDGTAALVERYLQQQCPELTYSLIKNEQRQGALANIYHAVHSCNDSNIIITLDGDDWFAHNHVLETLNNVYQDPAILMTYGQYVTFCGAQLGVCNSLPQWVVERAAYRSYSWVSSHLRTFYAGLFKRIKKEDLMYENDFFSVTWDMAFMYPLLEMAGGRHAYIPDILYVYNDANPINDYKVRLQLLKKCEYVIRNKPPYQALEKDVVFA